MTKTPTAYPPCTRCGRATRIRDDGHLIRHRVTPDPLAPWCAGSVPKELTR